MTLTKEIINEYREYLYQLSSDGEHPRMVDTLCDMALKTLSVPAPLSSEAVGKAVKKLERCVSKFNTHFTIKPATWLDDHKPLLVMALDDVEGALALLTPSPSEREKP